MLLCMAGMRQGLNCAGSRAEEVSQPGDQGSSQGLQQGTAHTAPALPGENPAQLPVNEIPDCPKAPLFLWAVVLVGMQGGAGGLTLPSLPRAHTGSQGQRDSTFQV